MFDSAWYFIWGFLAAGLIALVASPAIWNRAVMLTRRRIERSVPLTYSEVQADKDHLRAEFAVNTRKLELTIEEMKEKANHRLVEINRKRDELADLTEESRKKTGKIRELKTQITERDKANDKTQAKLAKTEVKLEESASQIERLREKQRQTQLKVDSTRIELVASQTSLVEASDQLEERDEKISGLKAEMDELRENLTERDSELDLAASRSAESDSRMAQQQKKNADLEFRLAKYETETAQVRDGGATEDDTSDDAAQPSTDEHKRESKQKAMINLAASAAKSIPPEIVERNLTDKEDATPPRKPLSNEQLEHITRDRDALISDLSAIKADGSPAWEDERKEQVILRERLNDLAARVTAETAQAEGPSSPINEILEKDARAGDGSHQSGKAGARQVISLADRIRAQ